MKDILVSEFKNFMTPTPSGEVSLLNWLTNKEMKNAIETIRLTDDDEVKKNLKKLLPCITPSGTFSKRNVNGLLRHSGYICIDIDGKDNPQITDFNDCRNMLSTITNVLYAGLSVSGNGVFAIIPIQHPEKHKEHFQALEQCFGSIGIVIDKACKDVSRLRAASYDENGHINLEALAFERYQDPVLKRDKIRAQTVPKTKSVKKIDRGLKTKVQQLIDKIHSASIDIASTYPDWFQLGCVFANEFEEDGRDFFHQVSQYNPTYYSEKTDMMFDQCLKNGYGYKIGTLFHLAKQAGIS